MEFYKHSGRFGAMAIPMVAAVGLIAALVGGVLYSYLTAWCPIIYVNVLGTLGFGFGLGFCGGHAAKLGKVRSFVLAALAGFLIGAAGLYVAWGTDFLARVGGDKGVWMVFRPLALYQWVAYCYENGIWSIGSSSSGGNVTGIPLAIVWLIEAGIVLGVSTMTAATIVDEPFCELCDRWIEKNEDVRRWCLGDNQQQTIERLVEQGDLTALDELFNGEGDEPNFFRLDTHHCAVCEESCFLSFKLVFWELNSEGEPEQKIADLLERMSCTVDDLRAACLAGRDPTEEERKALRPWDPELNPEKAAEAEAGAESESGAGPDKGEA